MKTLIQFKTTIPPVLVCMLLVCNGLSPRAQAVVPAPDGGYPGRNTAEGENALLSLTSGANNTAVGWFSLRAVTEGQLNTAIGAGTLFDNTGHLNTATGAAALFSNTIGFGNTASGGLALFHNTIGNNNTANGAFAIFNNMEGGSNTAAGDHALFSNTSGDYNTATGLQSLFSNTTGDFNTATGLNALYSNTTGNSNTAIGNNALFNNTEGGINTAIGAFALENSTGGGNIALGFAAGNGVTTASDVICIGTFVIGANVNNTTWVRGIYGVTTQSGTTLPVVVSENGQLGTASSSRRFKKEINPMDQASEAILGLKPVTFHSKSDKKSTPQFGLIAEEVAQVNPDLVTRDKNGDIYTVRYDAVNAMLLNEFLKEHKTVQELKKEIAALKEGLQKVSAQLELSKAAQQVVNNP